MINHQQLITTGLNYEATSLRYPFAPDLPVLFVMEKMFALLGHRDDIEMVNLKTSPDEAWLHRGTYPDAVFPGYHMNKKHWNTVLLNGSLPDQVILDMLFESYQRVIANLPKAARESLRLRSGMH